MASTIRDEPTSSAVVENSSPVAIEAKLILASGHLDCQKLKDLMNKEKATPMTGVIEFSRGKVPSSSAAAVEAPLMVSAGHGECQELKNLPNKKDATLTVVAMSSHNRPSEAKPSLTGLQLRLLAAASEGDSDGLKSLLNSSQGNTDDVEEGAINEGTLSLLKVITADGDTTIHLLAASGAKDGDSEKFKRCAELIHKEDKDKILLYQKNKKGDTPLHCAARAGKSQLVCCMIALAQDDGKAQPLLRMENDKNETPLHEAVRNGDKQIVKELLRAYPELASFPTNGTSPLYLAIQLIDDDKAILLKEDRQTRRGGINDLFIRNEQKSMAQTLFDESKGSLSYLGRKGQNALHAAVLRGPVLIRKLLRWNKDLILQRDENGSTPLHFAAGVRRAHLRRGVCSALLEASTDALYQMDNDGLYPIHVAASVGALNVISLFVKKCPGSASLRDANGRTYLHVAVENKQVLTVACMNRSLQAWITNMQDNDGNTALHVAVQAVSLLMFSALFANRNVHLNIANAEGQTPLDIAHCKVPSGLHYYQNSEEKIRYALTLAGARSGASRGDHFQKIYRDMNFEHESKELEDLKDLTQTQSIASVLIATVAFGATFALPGGYRADDHANGGTPIFAGRYAFDAFMMANTLAFIFSGATIICLVRGGSPTFNRHSRKIYLGIAFYFMKISVTCFIAAFALGMFVVLSPVARKTAFAICLMSPFVVLCNNAEFWLKCLLLLPSFLVRMGPLWTAYIFIQLAVVNTLYKFWPFLLIFIWAAYGSSHPISRVEPPSV